MVVFQGYLLGSLGLMVLGGMVLYLLFDGFAYFQGVSLSICFVDIYGLVLLYRGLGRYPLEDDSYIYCFLL